MISSLLQELASKIMIDRRADVSGLDLINQVISDPGVLWRKYFFTTMQRLNDDQQEVVLNWFLQMTKVSSISTERRLTEDLS